MGQDGIGKVDDTEDVDVEVFYHRFAAIDRMVQFISLAFITQHNP